MILNSELSCFQHQVLTLLACAREHSLLLFVVTFLLLFLYLYTAKVNPRKPSEQVRCRAGGEGGIKQESGIVFWWHSLHLTALSLVTRGQEIVCPVPCLTEAGLRSNSTAKDHVLGGWVGIACL